MLPGWQGSHAEQSRNGDAHQAMSFWIAHTKATGLAVALETETPCPTLCIAAGCRCLHSIPDNALQGESTRRFDFRNTADTPETIDTLRLGPYLQPFSLHSPLPRVPRVPWGTRVLASGQNHAQLQRCSAFPILSLPQPPACPVFTPILPHFHPDGTYHPFLPRFYPGFTPFWRVNCVGVKRRVKTG